MISIIVPYHKGRAFLEDCLNSIASQQYKDIETVLVFDRQAMTSDKGEMPEKIDDLLEAFMADNKLVMVEMTEKTGVAAARNLGMANASGDFVYFLDSDDYLVEDTLSNLMSKTRAIDDLSYSRILHTWFKRAAFNVEQPDADNGSGDSEFVQGKESDGQGNFSDIYMSLLGNKKKLNEVSALGILIKKSFLLKNNITFDENQKYYADVKFVAQLLKLAENYSSSWDSVYAKRYHNDEIKYPSLDCIEDENRIEYFTKAYLAGINVGDKAAEHFEYMVADYYVNEFARKYYDSKPGADREFDLLSNVIFKVDKSVCKKFGRTERKILKAAAAGDKSSARKYIRSKLIKRKLTMMFSEKKHFYRTINLYVFNRMPVKQNWILFESFVGRNCSGQPKYIYKYLQEHYGNEYRYIWVVNDKKIKIEGKHKKVKRFSLGYYYYMTRCKYQVNNMRQPLSIPKRNNQILLSTWHGTPLKKLVFDMDDVHSANPRYKDIVYRQTRKWDYLLSDNPFSTEVFQSCFKFDKNKILEYGYPANDPMYAEDREALAIEIKEKLGIPKDKKVILYAPTWRDDSFYGAGEYKFELALDINRLKEEVGDEYVLLLRMHYWIVDNLDLTQFGDFVYDGSSHDDITELYLISDMCITDYSSVFFDYANMRRPILFYMYDLEKYRDVLRGFYLDVDKELPGPILQTNDELVEAVKNINRVNKEYADKYNRFYRKFCCVDDGHAAERVVNEVFRNKRGGR
ncbi:MAG: bifunctional glycosyltransferase family 2 protein/CDP-glycerol:glycerophosphate glycerophosphotransferase [Lachnospiraceae bacterium]|nr:bifunctional glycosyltransferase family 2 protein/CDP-glycerol:glycerophosphate glycerophosphotransferase [Lachnospiraceae bacterium]